MRHHRSTLNTVDKQLELETNREACKKWRKKKQFPPDPASTSRIHDIISGFVEDSAFEQINESGCAVCGCLSPNTDL
ncbi:hypothetical protein BDW22DRAFT_1340583, partial [Trametopsis cervina]